MARYKEAQVTLEVLFKVATDKAIRVVYEDDAQWIPRSTLSFFTDRDVDDWPSNSEQSITLAQWMADKQGWT